jgi:iron complex transport system substrate-binding protein
MHRKQIFTLAVLIVLLAACQSTPAASPARPGLEPTSSPEVMGTPLAPELAALATQANATTFAAATRYPSDPAGQSIFMTQAAATMQAIHYTPTATQPPITLLDGLGRPVSLANPAKRVISMAPSNTEVLFAVGAGEQVVGRDEFSDYPASVKTLPSVGGSMGQYSLEQIVALKPDLVLAGGINTPEQVKALEDLGLTVFYLGNPTTLEEMYANLATVGQLTGRGAEAREEILSLQARVAAVDKELISITARPSVFYEIDASDPNKPYTAGKGTFIDQLISRAGGVNVAADVTDPYPQLGLEQLVVSDPAIILLGDSAYGVTAEQVSARPGWLTLSAVKNARIYTFDDNLVSRPGPRLVDGFEQLAKLLHPELFQ